MALATHKKCNAVKWKTAICVYFCDKPIVYITSDLQKTGLLQHSLPQQRQAKSIVGLL